MPILNWLLHLFVTPLGLLEEARLDVYRYQEIIVLYIAYISLISTSCISSGKLIFKGVPSFWLFWEYGLF
jgi:hypothetical protein